MALLCNGWESTALAGCLYLCYTFVRSICLMSTHHFFRSSIIISRIIYTFTFFNVWFVVDAVVEHLEAANSPEVEEGVYQAEAN